MLASAAILGFEKGVLLWKTNCDLFFSGEKSAFFEAKPEIPYSTRFSHFKNVSAFQLELRWQPTNMCKETIYCIKIWKGVCCPSTECFVNSIVFKDSVSSILVFSRPSLWVSKFVHPFFACDSHFAHSSSHVLGNTCLLQVAAVCAMGLAGRVVAKRRGVGW